MIKKIISRVFQASNWLTHVLGRVDLHVGLRNQLWVLSLLVIFKALSNLPVFLGSNSIIDWLLRHHRYVVSQMK